MSKKCQALHARVDVVQKVQKLLMKALQISSHYLVTSNMFGVKIIEEERATKFPFPTCLQYIRYIRVTPWIFLLLFTSSACRRGPVTSGIAHSIFRY